MNRIDLAFVHIEQGRVDHAVDVLEAERATGNAEATHQLARLHLYGMLGTEGASIGEVLVNEAADAGLPAACYTRALVEAGRPGDRWHADLRIAARAGHPLALRSLGLLHAAQADHASRAYASACLRAAAMSGDQTSTALLQWLAQAGVASASHPSSMESLLDSAPVLDLARATTRPNSLGPQEDWRLEENAISALEAHYLKVVAAPLLAPSRAIDPESGGGIRIPIRTSADASIDPLLEDVAMRLIQTRLCALAGLPLLQSEPMVVLRYGIGQEYRLHRDLLPQSTLEDPHQGKGGQRCMTVIAYLNEVQAGGETVFPRRDLRIDPKPGAALVFRNLKPDGSAIEDSLHAGLPVQRGEKWIATLWIRCGAVRGF